jgi:hypothetical protein
MSPYYLPSLTVFNNTKNKQTLFNRVMNSIKLLLIMLILIAISVTIISCN